MQTSLQLSLQPDETRGILERLSKANAQLQRAYPGDRTARQPVHTLYGGAHLFKAGSHLKLGSLAVRAVQEYAPNFVAFAKAVGFPGADRFPSSHEGIEALQKAIEQAPNAARETHRDAWMAYTIYQRVLDKLQHEPVEEMRVDFEDGYGNRPDDEEDAHAVFVGQQFALGLKEGTLPPFIGFRIKSFTEESRSRAIRTLDLVISHLAQQSGGKLPANFVVTLPKVTIPEQVAALAELLDKLEEKHHIQRGAIGIDIMIETTQAIINSRGENTVNLLVQAGQGRVRSAAFGTYDYTAICNITAHYQTHTHPAADFARHVLQVCLAGTGVTISDGATTVMPIGPHKATPDKPLTPEQVAENRSVVLHAWKLHYDNIRHSLEHGYYQGWDLNPAQLPIRYAAVYRFFIEGVEDASRRLNRFIDAAAKATLSGNVFDDAATGQGLLNFFLRGIACGALTEQEALATGITIDELHGRSFVRIVQNRLKNVSR